MKTNYFFVSSPLHLLFSSNLALRHDGDHNIVVLMPRENRQFSPFADLLAEDKSIFDEVISFETGHQRSKFAERRRRMALIREAVLQRPADRMFTGTDRRVEFQYAMHIASRVNPDVIGNYVDDGMVSYLGHRSIHGIAHRYIDPLFKKLTYGWWWSNPLIIGCSAWISEAHVAYPDLVHELLKSQNVDLDYLVRYSNAPWLVREEPGHPEHGLFLRDEDGNPQAWERENDAPVNALLPDISPALAGTFEMPDGVKARPAFEIMANRYLDTSYSAENVAERTGVSAETTRRHAACACWTLSAK